MYVCGNRLPQIRTRCPRCLPRGPILGVVQGLLSAQVVPRGMNTDFRCPGISFEDSTRILLAYSFGSKKVYDVTSIPRLLVVAF